MRNLIAQQVINGFFKQASVHVFKLENGSSCLLKSVFELFGQSVGACGDAIFKIGQPKDYTAMPVRIISS